MSKTWPSESRRVLIVGNSGSGKSWLANKLSTLISADHIDLDRIHWRPGAFNRPHPQEYAISAVQAAAREETWVIEGIFGWLAKEAASRATHLLWITVPEAECITNLKNRKIKSGEDELSRTALYDWCLGYRSRTSSSSYTGHEMIYRQFGEQKHILNSRREMDNLLSNFVPVGTGENDTIG